MATLILGAAGAAIGGAAGGSVLGLSGTAIGRATGAVLGRALDERLLGSGSAPVETGRIDRLRLTGAAEGAPVARIHGAVRLGGQVIWASPLRETATTTRRGGKGAPRAATTEYGYSVSLAIALCEGEVTGLGRIWADGAEIAPDSLTLSLYRGTEDQLPDPRIEAEEGAGRVPAFRGIAYLVIEDLDLAPFGNRIPQFAFEVFRPGPRRSDAEAEDLSQLLRAVCLIPGTGEYSLATRPVHLDRGFGEAEAANVNSASGRADLLVSLDRLAAELPRVRSVSLVVCWFGDDLRAGQCRLRPKVEQTDTDAPDMPWRVSGLPRASALAVPQADGRPVYGGTPADASVIEAIRELRARGQKVMFYSFILMEQMPGNALPDPYTGATGQPVLPWRGRITLSAAPGRPGSPDGTAAAEAEVAAFFGAARPGDFRRTPDGVLYEGPEEWSFRRMILHYAHLCAEAGGVDAFCIGTEMRGLTTIRGAAGYPAVDRLRTLAAEVRAILPGARITYAADWSEYHGHQPPGTQDKVFHLDPLWADPAIDMIGIDNYLPLSDWRDGEDHADARWGAIHDLGYLQSNVAGGEYHDWFYHSDEAREAQIRTPITDGLGEPWIWRIKDIRSWWERPHHDRVGGVRSPQPTAWVPRSKPIWFTEIGCAAIDKGTNEPNKFLDPKSSESVLPRASSGLRDDLIPIQYYRALFRHFADPEANPVSPLYGGRMVDMDRAHAWAWDARPWPRFPLDRDLWSDGDNYARGHWLNGRATARPLACVVEEVCREAGVTALDTARLHGVVRGMATDGPATARETLQPLMLAHGFDAAERDGRLVFASRRATGAIALDAARLALPPGEETALRRLRAPEAEAAGQVSVGFLEAGGDYAAASAGARLPDDPRPALSRHDLPLVLLREEARGLAERWLAEARLGRETARFALPPSMGHVGPGDTVRLDGALWRVDRLEDRGLLLLEAQRVEPESYRPFAGEADPASRPQIVPALPVEAVFLDLPLLRGDEAPHAPHVAFAARRWHGLVTLLQSEDDSDYAPALSQRRPAVAGTTLTPLAAARPGLWDLGPALRVRLASGALASASLRRVLGGANAAAIGDGQTDLWEVFQFAEAELVAPRTWDLRLRLRGQAGTDGVMPRDWPAGSRFVLLDGAVGQWAFPPAWRGRPRHYRWGPASRPPSDPAWRHREVAFRGVGLRPYAVCHLRTRRGPGGLAVSWTRRTRIEGDRWSPPEVPLGEEREAYLVRLTRNGRPLREVEVTEPRWTWTPAMQAQDGPAVLSVAQISDRWGPGPFRSIEVAP
ncbi:glycoside hydrolase/phage tail family protein [Rubellimicrobium sp. CFH 75288]|uniref:baseplate multidomain protein megatron n=1 Tax=Rubellimicrobium sp. CFH 75288 TaxID=2697034 RepID=UPI00141309FA|nr:glycoside hydrolase/phage tail family protein [Rubellimicrobium sp. CFH 75288]NAZ35513.1 host specificity protein [Rubellimicrobium sp. CFH 75288]